MHSGLQRPRSAATCTRSGRGQRKGSVFGAPGEGPGPGPALGARSPEPEGWGTGGAGDATLSKSLKSVITGGTVMPLALRDWRMSLNLAPPDAPNRTRNRLSDFDGRPGTETMSRIQYPGPRNCVIRSAPSAPISRSIHAGSMQGAILTQRYTSEAEIEPCIQPCT